MDDRDVITRFWANPAGIPYPFRALHDAGTTLRMGSDAPVAPLDPWLAISAAVLGTESSDREPFQPSSASMCIPRWQPRPPLAVTALHPATRPMWCCWTRPIRRRYSGSHARYAATRRNDIAVRGATY